MEVTRDVILQFIFFSVAGILSGKADIQISPQGTAYVEENNPLTLTCSARDIMFNLISWTKVDSDSYSIRQDRDPCEDRNTIDPSIYQFSCSGNTFTWTILNVNKQEHNDQWFCTTNDAAGTESSRTSIYVQVRVTTVSFLSPTETHVTVTENVLKDFECKTSEERPRSTIKWYISSSSGSSVSLGTGRVTQADDDLAITISTLRYSFNRTVSGQKLYCTAFNINGQTPVESNGKEIIVEYGTNGPPLIDNFTSGSTYKAILSEWQSLVCSVTGGYPTPTLTWNCFNGTVTTEPISQSVVKKRISWRASAFGASTCTCLSNQKVSGLQTSSLSVDVLYPPSSPVFYINSTAVSGIVKVIRNKNIDVKCETFSNPSPTYEWLNNVGGQWLRFPNVDKTDEKTYTCKVENSMVPSKGEKQTKSALSSLTLEVLSPPDTPIFKVGTNLISSNLSVVKGDNVRVICEATADPSPHTYRWTGQSSGNNILTINDIKIAGTRRCTATNTMTPTVGLPETKSSNALLNIIVMRGPTTPIVLYRSSAGETTRLTNEQLLVIKGTDFSLVCSGSNSIPAPTYRWFGKKTSNTDIISFDNIDINDDGRCTCNVENTMVRTVGNTTYGGNSSYVVIEILTKPEVESFQFQTVVENQPLTVPCTASGNPDPTSYTWTRSQDNFRQTQSTLNIPNTRRGDTDVYTCTARNTMLPTVDNRTIGVGSRTVDVRILYHPGVTVSALNGTSLTEGAINVILLCSAKGEPQEYKFSKWIQYAPDGITKVKDYDSSHIEGGNAYMIFEKVSYMDSGIYHCFVTNGIGDYRTGIITATNNTTQTVKGKPVITEYASDVAIKAHTNATLKFVYYSNDGSVPRVQWYKLEKDTRRRVMDNDHSRLHIKTGFEATNVEFHSVPVPLLGKMTKLLITNVQENDFGVYEVEVINNIGSAEVKRTRLVSMRPPDAPYNVTVLSESVTSSSITLSWYSGSYGGAEQTFYVLYKSSQDSLRQKGEAIFGGTQINSRFTGTISGLRADTSYTFHLFSQNVYGSTYSSFIIYASTKVAKVSGADGLTDNNNTGAVAGGVVAGVLGLIVIGLVLILLRKSNRLPVCRNKKKSGTTNQSSRCMENNTAVNTDNLDDIRSSGNVYDDLNAEREAIHMYAVLQGDTAPPNQRHVGKKTEKKVFDSSLDMEQLRENQGKIKDASNATGAVTYSNLKLAAE